MKVDVTETRPWARRLTITVPSDAIDKERRQVAKRIASRLRLPGFRKGKVPPGVVEQRYGAAIDQETIERVVNNAYRQAIREHDLQPITEATIDNIDYDRGADLTFNVEFEIRPQVELTRLGGFRAKRQVTEIGDSEVDRVLERFQQDHAVWQPVEDGAKAGEGDMVAVEITPEPDEDEAEADDHSVEPRRYDIVLGQDQALPDVESAIQTLEPGQEEEFTIEVPEAHEAEDSPPHTHHVRIRLLSIKRPDLPELNDDFAHEVGDFEDMAALRDRIRADLVKEADADADREIRRQLMDQVLEANPFEAPDSMVNEYLNQLIRPREGAEEEVIAEARASARPAAERAIKRLLVIERIAELESLHATQEEVDARINELAERVGRKPAEVRRQLAQDNQSRAIAEEITEDKVYDYLQSVSEIE
ncbi:MAG: trigger factor [Gemmatimonadota bacterium]